MASSPSSTPTCWRAAWTRTRVSRVWASESPTRLREAGPGWAVAWMWIRWGSRPRSAMESASAWPGWVVDIQPPHEVHGVDEIEPTADSSGSARRARGWGGYFGSSALSAIASSSSRWCWLRAASAALRPSTARAYGTGGWRLRQPRARCRSARAAPLTRRRRARGPPSARGSSGSGRSGVPCRRRSRLVLLAGMA